MPLALSGEVKGVQKIKYKSKSLDFVSQGQRLFMYFNVFVVIGFLGIYAYNSIFHGIPVMSDWTVWLLIFLLPVATFWVIFDTRQMRDTAKIPKGLSVFEKDDIGIKRRD